MNCPTLRGAYVSPPQAKISSRPILKNEFATCTRIRGRGRHLAAPFCLKPQRGDWGYNQHMIIQAGDLAVEIDTGTNEPGQILQRLEAGERIDYPPEKPLIWPLDYRKLPPGKYPVGQQ